MMSQDTERYNVGGVWLSQPFKIRRLGHVGITIRDMDRSLQFYRDLIGFKVTDWYPFDLRFPEAMKDPAFRDAKTVFMRYAGDHHSFVLLNRPAHAILEADPARRYEGGITIQQMSWQVGTLREVVNADEWLHTLGVETQRAGRDMPGSNWHTYFYDVNGYINELFYGMEQIGWSGFSKPAPMHARLFDERPPLPQMSEYAEVNNARAEGVDLLSGMRDDELPETYDVDGILLARPFKVTQIGPIGLFVPDVDDTARFYQSRMGFRLTESVTYRGYTVHYLRVNTEHHSLALFPMPLRETLQWSAETTTAFIGIQVANFAQLKAAYEFLSRRGVPIASWPRELMPGIDYAFWARDPDGHHLLFYYRMDQVGWSGVPRARTTGHSDPREWPEVIEDDYAYQGMPYLGPLG
ncbi:MAG: VOC family protein [Firmicutes bacterium]|nr:VOC family protein [Bacillota bacterium]